MLDLLAIIPVAAVAYIATNLDNLTLLVTLLARFRNRTLMVCCGYLASSLVMGFAGFSIGYAANAFPVEYLGLLGLVPMAIGAMGIVQLYRGSKKADATSHAAVDGRGAAFVVTFVTQLGNGTDTVITFAALFADSTPGTDLLIVFTLAAMAVIFVLAAIYGVRHPVFSQWIERYAHRLTPWILIVVGIYIVANTATDLLPG